MVGNDERRLMEREKVVWSSNCGGITGVVGIMDERFKLKR